MENQETKTVELTAAELELIEARRQKEAAEAAEREAQKKITIEKALAKMELTAESFRNSKIAEAAVWNDLITELNYNSPNSFVLASTDRTETIKARLGWNYQDEVVDEVVVPYKSYSIKYRTNESIYITLEIEHDRPRYQIHGIDDGWNKHYRTAKTIVAKVNEFIEKKQAIVRRKQQTTDSLEIAHQLLVEENPDATVEKKTFQESRYDYSRRSRRFVGYTEIPEVTVTFANGLVIRYRMKTENGEVKTFIYTYDASKLDKDAVIEALKNAPASVR